MYACSLKWPADWISPQDLEDTLRVLAGKIKPSPWGAQTMSFAGLPDLARKRGYTETNEGYLSKCHLCVDVHRFLVLKGDFHELKPKTFYDQLDDPAATPSREMTETPSIDEVGPSR